ncbi:hypothetical protein [Pseudomonas sp. BF-R-24]|uniref:hypothetical protein n=1 Tax=Pseudomonas sp. BF-R-24 TaxID=2832386 RepID=UPI001CC1A850|nr:hypothetical protein [Pseudomonas sp. BF-R-24]
MKMDVEKWLGYLSRFLNIIRPKAYNVIARIVVGAGAAVVLSQTKIVEALIVAAVEFYFGRSDVLREFLNQESSLGWGFGIIALGLVYHLSMTVGVDLVSERLQRLPKYPVLALGVRNADSEEYGGKKIQMRGALCQVPDAAGIPDHVKVISVPRERGGLDLFGGSFTTNFLASSLNSDFYRDRSEYFRTWGGAELLRFTITNDSPILAKNVSVCFVVSKAAGVAMDNTNDDFPTIPSAKKDGMRFLPPVTAVEKYDIKRGHTGQEYIFSWDVGDVQAGTVLESKTLIFLRAERDIEIRTTIYCDDFPEPVNDTYEVKAPTSDRSQISVADLKVEDTEFTKMLDDVVMDGYLRRRAEQEFNKYQHEAQEYLPK